MPGANASSWPDPFGVTSWHRYEPRPVAAPTETRAFFRSAVGSGPSRPGPSSWPDLLAPPLTCVLLTDIWAQRGHWKPRSEISRPAKPDSCWPPAPRTALQRQHVRRGQAVRQADGCPRPAGGRGPDQVQPELLNAAASLLQEGGPALRGPLSRPKHFLPALRSPWPARALPLEPAWPAADRRRPGRG
jgi:hypothetical protein